MTLRSLLTRAVLPLLAATSAWSQAAPDNFDGWLQDRIDAAVAKARIGINGKSMSRQIDGPSGDDRSTSLVDHSSASDFVSTALNLVPINNGTGSNGSGSGTVSASLYSLLAGLNKKSMTDPTFYASHTAARQVSFTAGQSASDPVAYNTSKNASVIGVKVTPVNARDLYSKNGQKAIADVQKALTASAVAYAPLASKVKNLVFLACKPDGLCKPGHIDVLDIADADIPAFIAFWAKFQNNMRSLQLSQDNTNQIQQMIQTTLTAFTDYQTILEKSYDRIHGGRQLAFAYTVNLRPNPGFDVHRVGMVFDYGLSDAILWTMNADANIIDRRTITTLRGASFAMEFKGRITRESTDPDGRRAATIAFSAKAKWLTKTTPQYQAQMDLTVPIAPGIDLPVCYRWANHKLMVDQSGSELHMGLSMDLGRLAQLFK